MLVAVAQQGAGGGGAGVLEDTLDAGAQGCVELGEVRQWGERAQRQRSAAINDSGSRMAADGKPGGLTRGQQQA